MKKQLVIIGIIALLVCVGLSGCNQINNSVNLGNDRFVGTWKGPIKGDVYSYGNYTTSITFLSDGTYSSSIDSQYMNMATGSGTWEIKDGMLVITSLAGQTIGQASTFNYQFSNDDKALLLIDTNTALNMNLIEQ